MVDREKPAGERSINPDLIFTSEVPPIPTTLFAVNIYGGQGIIIQSLENGKQYSIISVDHSWEPVELKNEEDALRAILMTGMIPVETETGELVKYSSQAEAIADLRQQFIRANPPPDISLESILELVPVPIRKLLEEANE